MTVIPSIDILDGKVVRLRQGSFEAVTEYGADPTAIAKQYVDAGAQRIHIVDLNAAQGGRSSNRKRIIRIRRTVDCVIQLGGGVRSDEDVETFLDLGIDRIVLGTIVAERPHVVEGWAAHYGRIFIAAVDAAEGLVRTDGWLTETQIHDVDLVSRLSKTSYTAVLYTSIGRDGTMYGPDLEHTAAIADATELPVIASGGVASLDHVRALHELDKKNLVAAISGRAVLEGELKLEEAFAEFPSVENEKW